jgi:Mu transposase-like protein
LYLRGQYGFHAHPCRPATPREKGSGEAAVRYLETSFWPARRFRSLVELDERYSGWRDQACNRRLQATRRFRVDDRLAEERRGLRPLPPLRFDWSGHRSTRVPIDGYLRQGGCFYRARERLVHERVELCFDRDQIWITHRAAEVARYPRRSEQGVWLPAPIMRCEPPSAPPPLVLPRIAVASPELADYAELCA